MKVKAYIRVGRSDAGKTKVVASARPSERPLEDSFGLVPTVAFALMLDLPDALFKRAEQVIAELKVPEGQATIAAKVTPREPAVE